MKKEIENTTDKVNVKSLFPNMIGIKHLDLSKLKITGKEFKETFEFSQKITPTTTSGQVLGVITSETVSGLGWTRNLEGASGGIAGGISASFKYGSLYGIVP